MASLCPPRHSDAATVGKHPISLMYVASRPSGGGHVDGLIFKRCNEEMMWHRRFFMQNRGNRTP